ncbi:MAG: hypothetical protein R3223_09080 [Longimicrobiales bacterium]|nr:hypothetical protein [Longimicrobiales bacterium]
MRRTAAQSSGSGGRSTRLLSVVGLWLLTVSFVAPSPLSACQNHWTGGSSGSAGAVTLLDDTSRSGTLVSFGPSISSSTDSGTSTPPPGEHGHGSDECCGPAPCGAVPGLTAPAARSAVAASSPKTAGPLFGGTAGPVASVDPFLLPFAIPPPFSA